MTHCLPVHCMHCLQLFESNKICNFASLASHSLSIFLSLFLCFIFIRSSIVYWIPCYFFFISLCQPCSWMVLPLFWHTVREITCVHGCACANHVMCTGLLNHWLSCDISHCEKPSDATHEYIYIFSKSVRRLIILWRTFNSQATSDSSAFHFRCSFVLIHSTMLWH